MSKRDCREGSNTWDSTPFARTRSGSVEEGGGSRGTQEEERTDKKEEDDDDDDDRAPTRKLLTKEVVGRKRNMMDSRRERSLIQRKG